MRRKMTFGLKHIFLAVSMFGFLCAFFSCAKDKTIEMQSLAMEELSPRVEWALVSDPYVACRKEAGYENETVASFRKGEIYEVKGNRSVKIDGENEIWYALEEGWVPASAVKVYSNKLKAEKAKQELK